MNSVRALLAVAVISAAGLLSGCAATDGLAVGRPAPELSVDSWVQPGGAGVSAVTALRGRDVFALFWSTHCPACRKEAPVIEELHRRYGPRGLVVVGVHVPMGDNDRTTPHEVAAFARKNGLTYAIGFDGSGASAWDYDYDFLPHGALIGRDGRIAWSGNLSLYDAENAIEEALGATASAGAPHAQTADGTVCEEEHVCRVGAR